LSLRIDANQGWNRHTALRALRGMEEFSLDFAEQPVAKDDIESLVYLSSQVSTPLLADESLSSLPEALTLIRRQAVGMFGIKLTKIGGMLSAKRLAGLAEAAGFPCYVGCMIETGIGTAAYLHFAVSTPAVTMGCELFGPLLLADTITENEPLYTKGCIGLSSHAPGLGIVVNETKLQKYTRNRAYYGN
jgi:muconate cycloisomerase